MNHILQKNLKKILRRPKNAEGVRKLQPRVARNPGITILDEKLNSERVRKLSLQDLPKPSLLHH